MKAFPPLAVDGLSMAYLQIRNYPHQEGSMQFLFKGNGDSLEVRLIIQWNAIVPLCKGVFVAVCAILALLSTPEIAQLIKWLFG